MLISDLLSLRGAQTEFDAYPQTLSIRIAANHIILN